MSTEDANQLRGEREDGEEREGGCVPRRGGRGGAEIRQEISRARPEPSEPSTVSSSGIHRREDLLTGRALLIIIVDKLDNIIGYCVYGYDFL